MKNKIYNFLKKYLPISVKVVFGLFVLYYLIFFLTPNVRMSNEQKKTIDSLNTTIKIIREDNLRLEKKISEFTEEIKIVDSNINNLKGQKTKIKEIYHEKISNVDKLTVPQLDSFFTNRYK